MTPGSGRSARHCPAREFRIADDGEIMLRGGGVMRGYHNNPEATAEVFTEDGWFHTGDIGELVDGYLRVTDRKKDLIKTSGGKYVAPQKVEVIFSAECPWAGHIVVHGEGRKFVSALITLDDEMIHQWAEQNGLAGKSMEELAKDPKVYLLAISLDRRLPELGRAAMSISRKLPHAIVAGYLPGLGTSTELETRPQFLEPRFGAGTCLQSLQTCHGHDGMGLALPPYLRWPSRPTARACRQRESQGSRHGDDSLAVQSTRNAPPARPARRYHRNAANQPLHHADVHHHCRCR